jgi:hypothetical protein
LIIILTCFLHVFGSAAEAQVIVYKVEFSDAKGINFHTFEGGYAVVPLLGGQASFLLTSTEPRRTFAESDAGATFFTAVSSGGDQKAVLSASTGIGTASGALVAIGDIDHMIRVNNRTVTLTARVAMTMTGTLVSADDESNAGSSAADGSLGSAGIARMRLSLDEDATDRFNRDSLTMSATLEQLKIELRRHGFSADDTSEPSSNPE